MAGQTLYRLRCGHRIYSRWLDHEHEAWKVALDRDLAGTDRARRIYPKPLVWVEKGHRRYAKRRIVPMTEELDGKALPAKFRNPLAPPGTYAENPPQPAEWRF
jgi:hypothetical protein